MSRVSLRRLKRSFKRRRILAERIGLCTALLMAPACGMLSSPQAVAELKSPESKVVGTARLTNRRAGVVVRLNVEGLPPGLHGTHIHSAASCTPPDFLSAGDHFDHSAAGHEHGRHSGDLPNLKVGPDGRGSLDAMIPGLTLEGTSLHSLFREGGTSLVIHEHADDMSPAESGGAGVRIACGEIRWTR